MIDLERQVEEGLILLTINNSPSGTLQGQIDMLGVKSLILSTQSFSDIEQKSNDESPTSKNGVSSFFVPNYIPRFFVYNNHLTEGVFIAV